MIKNFIVVSLILLVFKAYTQEIVELPKPVVKKIQLAHDFITLRRFDKAIQTLENIIKKYPKYAKPYIYLGKYQNFLGNYKESLIAYKKAIELQPNSPINKASYIYVAKDALHRGNYELAKAYSEKYLSFNPNDFHERQQIKTTKRIIETCEYAMVNILNPLDFNPENLVGEINKYKLQYFPTITADNKKIFFTARESIHNEDIFYAVFENDLWSNPISIPEFNTLFNEGTCSISGDGTEIVFTSCQNSKGRLTYGSCDLYISYIDGDKWTEPTNIGQNVNTRNWESQPTLSADGKTLYFVSERPGNIGGRDIWVTYLKPSGWSIPKNLGNKINTEKDEISPFIHFNNNVLFFSSNGHLGFGGFDIFKADRKEDPRTKRIVWRNIENIGYPINKHGDQVSLIVNADGTKGYFADEVVRNEQIIESTLKSFAVPKELSIGEKSYYVKGKVFDLETKEIIPSAAIRLVDVSSKEIFNFVLSDKKTGEYLIVFNEGRQYALYANSSSHLFKSVSLNYSDKSHYEPIEQDIYLERIQKNASIILNNIFFESGSYELKKESETELHTLINFLNQNKNLIIEIGGHTDDIGTEESNSELSLNRAKAVVDYISNKGISNKCLTYKGYGETMPKRTNDTDENRAFNRRIEFKIIEEKNQLNFL